MGSGCRNGHRPRVSCGGLWSPPCGQAVPRGCPHCRRAPPWREGLRGQWQQGLWGPARGGRHLCSEPPSPALCAGRPAATTSRQRAAPRRPATPPGWGPAGATRPAGGRRARMGPHCWAPSQTAGHDGLRAGAGVLGMGFWLWGCWVRGALGTEVRLGAGVPQVSAHCVIWAWPPCSGPHIPLSERPRLDRGGSWSPCVGSRRQGPVSAITSKILPAWGLGRGPRGSREQGGVLGRKWGQEHHQALRRSLGGDPLLPCLASSQTLQIQSRPGAGPAPICLQHPRGRRNRRPPHPAWGPPCRDRAHL